MSHFKDSGGGMCFEKDCKTVMVQRITVVLRTVETRAEYRGFPAKPYVISQSPLPANYYAAAADIVGGNILRIVESDKISTYYPLDSVLRWTASLIPIHDPEATR